MDELADVTITGPNEEWLAEFTRGLVTDGLAACGNIIPKVRSIYAWEGELQDDTEALVILHTRKALLPKTLQRAKEEHPDATPQVLALQVVGADPRYREWLVATTAEVAKPSGR